MGQLIIWQSWTTARLFGTNSKPSVVKILNSIEHSTHFEHTNVYPTVYAGQQTSKTSLTTCAMNHTNTTTSWWHCDTYQQRFNDNNMCNEIIQIQPQADDTVTVHETFANIITNSTNIYLPLHFLITICFFLTLSFSTNNKICSNNGILQQCKLPS